MISINKLHSPSEYTLKLSHMKIKNQIRFIKIGYITTLIAVFLSSLDEAKRGFIDGYNAAGNENTPGWMYGILLLFIAFFMLRVLVYLYRFIDSVQHGSVFNEENTIRLTRMGFYCTSLPFLLFALNAIDYVRHSGIQHMQLTEIIKHVDFEIWLLIFGLTLLTIAFVFQKGIELKQESDLTI